MPLLDTYQKPSKMNKFEKKAYRPWSGLDLDSEKNEENPGFQDLSSAEPTTQAEEIIFFDTDKNKTQEIQTKILNTNQSKNPAKSEITKISSVEATTFALRGLGVGSIQRKIVFFIVDLCIARKQLSSGPITHEMFLDFCQTNINIIKNAVQRLIKKGFFVRETGKKGKGGFCSFLIPEILRDVVVQEMQQPTPERKPIEQRTNFLKEEMLFPKTSKNFLPEEWASIDFFPLENIGFSINHIEQLYKLNKFTAQQIQESIYAFDFDLKENDKGKSLRVGPLNYFVGILRNGVPYAPPQNYENPLEKALKFYISLNERREQKQQELEQKALEMAFAEWEKKLSNEEVFQICEGKEFAQDSHSLLRKGVLVNYFKEKLWLDIKMTMLKEQAGNKAEI